VPPSVNADQVLHTNSPYLLGVHRGCEPRNLWRHRQPDDFWRRFAEPAAQLPLKDLKATRSLDAGGRGSVQGVAAMVQKLSGTVRRCPWARLGCDVKLTKQPAQRRFDSQGQPMPANGADVSMVMVVAPKAGQFGGGPASSELGANPRVPCDVPVNEWIKLTVRHDCQCRLEVLVNGKSICNSRTPSIRSKPGAVGLRIWQQQVLFAINNRHSVEA